MCLVNTCSVNFCVLAGMGLVWSSNVEMHYVSLLVSDVFGQYILICILCIRWHWRVLSLYGEIHFETSLAWDGYCQNMLTCNFCPRWHFMNYVEMHLMPSLAWEGFVAMHVGSLLLWAGLVNPSQDTFLSTLAWDGFGQRKLLYILSLWEGID